MPSIYRKLPIYIANQIDTKNAIFERQLFKTVYRCQIRVNYC